MGARRRGVDSFVQISYNAVMPDPIINVTNAVTNAAPLVELRNISVSFGPIAALQNVSLTLAPGVRHAVVGENGAGKSTLMKVLFGLLAPSSGTVLVGGKPQAFVSPADAIALKIGMVQQHFELIGAFTSAQNIVLGAEKTHSAGAFLSTREANNAVRELSEKSGLPIDPNARVDDLSVASQQRVEILKALYRNAQVLILDEPTATLAPSEARDLWAATERLSHSGTTVVFVTHKLSDVMAHADEVTVLRKGRHVFGGRTPETTPAALADYMVGSDNPPPAEAMPAPKTAVSQNPGEILSLQNVSVRGHKGETAVQNVSLVVRPGEIVGLAGVDGSGQLELLEAILGLRSVSSGQIFLQNKDISRLSTQTRREAGMGYVPEDRHHRALVLGMGCEENAVLGRQREAAFASPIGILKQTAIRAFLQNKARDFDVRGAQAGLPVKNLSGGNQQKLVMARELSRNPALLLVSQPTRGLDFGASAFVHDALRNARNNGAAVLLHSLQLDEILALSDRVAVMLGGKIVGVVPIAEATENTIGALMTGAAA